MLSYIILNEIEANEITGCSDAKASLEVFKKEYPNLRVMLTLGKKGCVYMDSETVVSREAFSVKAVDTTAAGDTFTGYFLAGISNGIEIEETLKLASCASAIAVSRPGAAPSIPVTDEVREMLRSM